MMHPILSTNSALYAKFEIHKVNMVESKAQYTKFDLNKRGYFRFNNQLMV